MCVTHLPVVGRLLQRGPKRVLHLLVRLGAQCCRRRILWIGQQSAQGLRKKGSVGDATPVSIKTAREQKEERGSVRTEFGGVQRQHEARTHGVEPHVDHGLEGEHPILCAHVLWAIGSVRGDRPTDRRPHRLKREEMKPTDHPHAVRCRQHGLTD